MAVNHKKLTSAKVRAALEGIESLLDRTEHDERLDAVFRAELAQAAFRLDALYKQLWHQEFLQRSR